MPHEQPLLVLKLAVQMDMFFYKVVDFVVMMRFPDEPFFFSFAAAVFVHPKQKQHCCNGATFWPLSMVMVVVVVTNSKGCQQTLNEKLLLLAYNGWHIFKSMNEEE